LHIIIVVVGGGANTGALGIRWLESAPGLEDWHPIEDGYGGIKRFWGGACTHFTTINESATTRVSLDFRCVACPAALEAMALEPNGGQYTVSGGYLFMCARQRKGMAMAVVGEVPEPSRLTGFPFR
jgi:hypothetical protein